MRQKAVDSEKNLQKKRKGENPEKISKEMKRFKTIDKILFRIA